MSSQGFRRQFCITLSGLKKQHGRFGASWSTRWMKESSTGRRRGLNHGKREEGLEAFADASFSPGGEESHGSVVISLRGGPLVWRSSRQSTVTLSTAEAELNEMIEGLMLGESVAAVVEELEPQVAKVMVSDSQAAVNIVQAEGGSWRTRHLRLRAAHAKQRFTKGDWVLQHRLRCIPFSLNLLDQAVKDSLLADCEDVIHVHHHQCGRLSTFSPLIIISLNLDPPQVGF